MMRCLVLTLVLLCGCSLPGKDPNPNVKERNFKKVHEKGGKEDFAREILGNPDKECEGEEVKYELADDPKSRFTIVEQSSQQNPDYLLIFNGANESIKLLYSGASKNLIASEYLLEDVPIHYFGPKTSNCPSLGIIPMLGNGTPRSPEFLRRKRELEDFFDEAPPPPPHDAGHDHGPEQPQPQPQSPPLPLLSVPPQTVEAGKPLQLTVTAENSYLWQGKLHYSLVPPAPPGASVAPQSGEFSWTPPQAAGAYRVTVSAQASDGRAAQTSFVITVLPPQLKLLPVTPQSVEAGKPLQLTATAANPDAWQGKLYYNLAPPAPPGASVDPQSGEFSWTPPPSQVAGTYPVTVSARAPDGQAARTSFVITVTPKRYDPLTEKRLEHNSWTARSPARGHPYKTVAARLVSYVGQEVVLEFPNGKQQSFRVSALGPSDQAFLGEFRKLERKLAKEMDGAK